jgi:hypothetical protein
MGKSASKILLLLVLLLPVLAACYPGVAPGMPAPTATPSTGTISTPNVPGGPATTEAPASAPADPLSLCPAATAELQRLVRPEARYCLAYPARYKVERPTPDETILLIGGLLNASDPRVHIRATDAGGETAETAADRLVKEFPDFTLEQTATTVAGAPAVVLDTVPGQEMNRRVLFVDDGLLYEFMFMPADPALGETYRAMNELQEQVLGSFTFLPEGVGVADECLMPAGGAQLHRDPTAGYCLLYPEGYSFQQTDGSETVFYAESLMNTAKPKLFVRVEDANGMTEKEIADALVEEIEQSGVGAGVERAFGVTLGYRPAEWLDRVPGQDLGRVIIAVNGPRAYRLTFIPADPAQGDVYAEMEAMYDMAMRSFRFLP